MTDIFNKKSLIRQQFEFNKNDKPLLLRTEFKEYRTSDKNFAPN